MQPASNRYPVKLFLLTLALGLLGCEATPPEFISPGIEIPTLKIGQQTYLKLAGGDTTPVYWSITDPQKADISRDGVVTALQITPGVIICAESRRSRALKQAIESISADRDRHEGNGQFSRIFTSWRADMMAAQSKLDSLVRVQAALEAAEDFEPCLTLRIVQQ